MNIKGIFQHPFSKLAVQPVMVYGVAYAGRSYLKINPAHAALFSFGTLVAAALGRKFAESSYRQSFGNFSKKTIHYIFLFTPTAIALARGILSPLQAITVIGLTYLSGKAYKKMTDRLNELRFEERK